MNKYDVSTQRHTSKPSKKVSKSKYFYLTHLVFQSGWKIIDASLFLGFKYTTAKKLIMKYRRTCILKKMVFKNQKRCNYKKINGSYSNMKIKCTLGGKRIKSIKQREQ
ncbi:unnamed protein product [Paramecium sonneborni]|uniref:Uncharacterized protein n=1 Tax=Paramecium sonneborni TaxID=65129 RepID=A0A8S1RKM0_9CILI|nr:unnamed protein product [Paramecium sonneborni]